MNSTFRIKYQVFFTDNAPEMHIIKVHNCMGDLHAKIKLQGYLKKKHANFERLVVISCNPDMFGFFDMFDRTANR